MKKHKIIIIISLSAIVGALAGSLTTFFLNSSAKPNTQKLISDFYLTENAVHVSPHTIRKKMDKGETDYVLVDLRSPQEYEKEHVIGAINIPAYKDPNTSISLDSEKAEKERIISSFRSLPKGKNVVVYCYSIPCMTGRKIGKLLVENGFYVQQLGVGWNEWRYFWNLWNHDGETPTEYKDYVISGKEPGKPKLKDNFSPCKVGELGC